jgi:hypothetical protein
VVIVLATYNNRTYVNRGLSKITRAKNIVAQRKKQNNIEDVTPQSSKEKLLEVYSGTEIDISDPNGYYLLNSGYRVKDKGGLGRIENPAFSRLMSDLFQRETFQQLAQVTTTPSEMMERAIDLNGKINVDVNQKTKTFSSIQDLKEAFDYLQEIKANKGDLFIFDTETIGGKNRTGIWNPLAITEFAMQQYNYGTGQTTKTNIVLGLADNADNRRVYEQILGYMEDENWAAIEKNEELFVTAKRVALYADAEMSMGKNGYYEITKLGDAKDNWKNKAAFEKGWQKLRDAYDNTSVTSNGLRRSDEALFDAVFRMQSGLNNSTAMAVGQNFQIFDEPVVNTQLKKTFNFYKEIVDDTTGKLAESRNISKAQATKAVAYMQNQLDSMGGGFNLPNRKTFDTLPLFKVVRDYFGANTLYNGDKEAIKAAGGGLAKQEYVGAAWFKDLFSDAMAHMADFDVTVLNYAMTQGLDSIGGKTLVEHLMTSAGKDKSGVYGIDNINKKIKTGQIFYSVNGTGSFDYAGKGMLNFTHNSKTGEVFTSSGYKFVNGQNLGYEDSKINMGTDLKTGHFFQLESVKQVKAADIHEQLGDVLPDMSGTDFILAQFKMAVPEGESADGLEYITYNYLFNSEKQFSGFMSSDMKMAVDIDENGKRYIVDGAGSLFDRIGFTPDGMPVRESDVMADAGIMLTDDEMINTTLKRSMKEFQTEKAYNAVFGQDSSYKNIEKMLNAKGFLESKEIQNMGLDLSGLNSEDISRIIDGKSIRNMTDEQTQYVSKKVRKIMGFYNKALGEDMFYSNTQRNMIAAWDPLMAQDKFYKTVLNNLNKESKARNWNNNQRAAAFNDLVETLRVQAAELISTGDPLLDKSRVSSTKIKELTAYQAENIYDVKIPLNFSIDSSSHVRDVESFSSSDSRNIIRLDLRSEKDASYSFVSRLRKEMYGGKELKGDTDYYNRKALSNYILNVMGQDENFKGTKKYKNIVKEITGQNADDYNVNVVARQVIDNMRSVKVGNPYAGILKELSVHTMNIGQEMTDALNSQTILDLVGYNIKNNMITPIDTKSLLKNKGEGMQNFVRDNLMSKYMPSKQAMIDTLNNIGATDKQIALKTKLYDTLYDDISAQLVDILTIGSKIDGMDMAIGADGSLTMVRQGQSVVLKGIPKIEMDNGHLYGMLGNQKLNLHLDLKYNDQGHAFVKSNLGDVFENSRYVSRRITKDLQEGNFRLEDFFGYVNKLGKDLREEASYSGTSGELLANYYVGTKDLNRILPHIFADEGLIKSDFMDSLDMPNDVKAALRKKFNQDFKIGQEIDDELDPAVRQMIGPYRVNIMRALAAYSHQDEETFNIINDLNVSSKDKSKLGKDVLVGANTRFMTGFTNPIDENSRPVIGGSGNVRYLLDENLNKAAEASNGILYKGALFESADTMYINRAYQEGIGQMSTTFTGRTAYVGEIGLRTILENNKDKVLRENKVIINQKDQTDKVYDFLYSYLNTFEQAKVFSAEEFDKISGGTMAADKKKLSLSKDIAGAIDLDSDEWDDLYDRAWNLRGKLVRGADGTISYISNSGEIVKHGDTLMRYASFGGTDSAWISKLNKGVFKYEIANNKGISLTDKQINELLEKNKDMFDGVNFNKEGSVHSIFEKMLKKEGLTAQYVVEDINKTTLPKILINDAEKSMNQLGYMRIGTVNENIRGVLQEYGGDAADFIGTTVPTPDAIRAAMNDKDKADKILSNFGFKNMDAFIEAVKEESYTADRMIFGKHGLFKGFVAIGNDNLAGHKNKGSMMTGAINDAILMLGKYDSGLGVENEEALKHGFKRFVELVNAGEGQDKDIYKFFKDANGKGISLELGENGIGLRLSGNRSLDLSYDNADIVDTASLEKLFERIDEIIAGKGAIEEDRLVHHLVKIDKDTGEVVRDATGKIVRDEGKTLGRAIFQEVDGVKVAYGSSGGAGMKIVNDSEVQSGMTSEYVEVKQQIRDMRAYKQELLDKVQGRKLNSDELEVMAGINLKLEGLENRARELKETGHLYKLGDRERNIFSQYMLNDRIYEKMEENVGEDIFESNSALKGLDRGIYSNDYKVFGFMEDELKGQLFYNPYEEDLLTKDMLNRKDYAHLKGVYEDIVERQGKNLGVKTAKDIHGVRMIQLANEFNNGRGTSFKTLKNNGFEIMSPEEYIKAFAAMGADPSENVAMKNVLIDLGEEFDSIPEWQGMNRYVAVPGMGTALEDVDIKKDWHKAASAMANIYQDDYINLQGQDTEEREKVINRLRKQVENVQTSTSNFVTKKNIVDNMAKTEIYAAMDRTKILSLPDEKNPILQQARVHGDTIANWQKKGVYYDAMFDSYEMFEKRGFFKEATLKEFGMSSEEEMKDYLRTHGAVMIDDRYPNIRDTSLTTARHYLMDDVNPHSTNATYMTKETLLKMLADSDGDSRSGFMLQQGRVSHALYERKRMMVEEKADTMGFKTDKAREKWIRQTMIDDGMDAETYDAFKGIDIHQVVEATTTNRTYHERAVKTNIDDLMKTRRAQMIMGGGESVIAELPDGKSILSRQKTLALNYDPSFRDVKNNLDEINNDLFGIIKNRMDDISKIDSGLATDLQKLMDETGGDILKYSGNEIDVLDKALYAVEQLGENKVLSGATVQSMQKAVTQRVRVNAYHAESLSKLGISAVGNVNHAFFGASQAMKNYYGVEGSSNYNKVKANILDRMAYEIEQSSISSKKITLKAGDHKVVTLGEILGDIKKYGLGDMKEGSNYANAMQWMQEHADAGKAVAQYENLLNKLDPVDYMTGKRINLNTKDEIANYMYDMTIRSFAEVYSNDDMKKVATAYSKIGSRKASADAIERVQGMMNNSFLGSVVEGITGVEADMSGGPRARGPKAADDMLDEGYRRAQQLGQTSADAATKVVKAGMDKMKHWATANPGAGMGRALALGAVSLAGGLIAAGYASGNPLNDANPEQVVQQQTKPTMSFGPDAPQMAPNNTGGYIINIKGDTKKGNRQLKKALKQAANSSVGGAVNINMSLKTSREGGYSNQDIENILSNYF